VDFLEFVDKNCSKAVAMRILSDAFSIDKSKMIAVGDGFNDLPMLTYAGLGVAMGNADARVKEKCGYVTGSCDEDGLAEFIEKYLL
ncbi:MAG: HAD hydrolase family protein, partial [Clostridia bacterium]|nr:HAD hydrolase family protein [Clostridia bacterium]